jgi:hypothetical protein
MVNFLGLGRSKANEEMNCNRLVKYDGKKLEITGLSIGDFKIGNLDIEPVLLQTVSHALMLLDASQYTLCTSISNLTDKQR